MSRLRQVLSRVSGSNGASAIVHRRLRTVPAAVLEGSELIQLGGGESVPCPGIGSLPLAASARRSGLGSPSLALPPARVHVLRDVRIAPSSRVVASGERIVAESLTADMVDAIDLRQSELRGRPIRIDGTVATYRSPWRPYFHTVVDHLPRAALLAQPAVRRLGPVTVVHDTPLTPIERTLLPQLLGPNVELLEVEPGTGIVADQVLLPGYVTRPSSGAIPGWYRRWIDREAASERYRSDGTRPRRRLYVDRTGIRRRVLNRAALDLVLERHDIETVDPLTMTIEDQISSFRDADLIVGVTGSGLVNTIFSRSAHVIELLPGAELLPHFYYLAAAKGLPYDYVAATPDQRGLSAEERLAEDVVVDTVALDRLLETVSV